MCPYAVLILPSLRQCNLSHAAHQHPTILEKVPQFLPRGFVAFAPFESYRRDYKGEKWFTTMLPLSQAKVYASIMLSKHSGLMCLLAIIIPDTFADDVAWFSPPGVGIMGRIEAGKVWLDCQQPSAGTTSIQCSLPTQLSRITEDIFQKSIANQQLIDEPANSVVSCMVIRSVRCYRGVIVATCSQPSLRWSVGAVLDLITRGRDTRSNLEVDRDNSVVRDAILSAISDAVLYNTSPTSNIHNIHSSFL
ncbi:hypothetical protein VNI00_004684 [Paramarasmius palmivorus]|uniref:Uncharacterized protein n=1 Tax=Paramarasmius palmivorus TaxID=297713 RepID=A0AAW0DEU7_9AGAR